jgi:hypothetical protein
MKYPKINSLWKRDADNDYVIMPGEFSCEEFSVIDSWQVSEKVDGTNIRIFFDGIDVRFAGRTDNAQLPPHLLAYLQATFTVERLERAFVCDSPNVVLFGEGYGVKIQKGGGLYRPDISFALFDVFANGWWLQQRVVREIADGMGIDTVAPKYTCVLKKDEIVELVKSRPQSPIAQEARVIEGLVARSCPLMLFRDGSPIMFKLKVSDYEKLEARNAR